MSSGPRLVTRAALIGKLRELGFKFARQAHQVDLWRAPEGAKRLSVPRKKKLSVPVVTSVLRQAGCSDGEIIDFIRDATG